ncbi:MAG: serine--tRNA ligase [Candidatus Actinomarina sp.]|jgi:seryl-tRNA synthetase|nr:serine--tRNA ligase [Actinomycetota bacterium]MBL6833353.1 serine--tRNA ligase [Candidatus Actinomarina sp.]MBL6836617.1 serine--tRNA ligase [Candidatus Actinomarina sp.]
MLDPQILRKDLDLLKNNISRRGLDIDINYLVEQDEKRRKVKFEAEQARSEQKNIGKEISQTEGTQKEKLLKKASELSENVKLLNEKYEQEEKLFFDQWIKIPNLVDESSPTGKTDQDNLEIKKVGNVKDLNDIKNHLEIGENLNLINVEKAAEVSGSRFSYIFGDLVKIELNLVSWVMDKLSDKDFTPTVPPVLVREEALFGTGFFPDDAEQVYEIPKDDLYLVGTSEVPLAALHSNEILDFESLPLRYAGFSTCFRREAGTYGKDTTGIFRVHQFDKVEMFSFCNPEKSKEEHEYLLSVEEEILQELEIPYRVVDVCTGDLGASASKKYDIEAWMPSQQNYREVTSCSNTTDFQARRLNIRTKIDGNTTTMHTLNGTALAVGRILIALIENNQLADGTVEFSDSLSEILGVKKLSKK